jgi:uncharacterized protein YciI
MLYLVTLTYICPMEEVQAHLDTHRDWLATHTRGGQILVAGPLEDHSGGFVLARSGSRAELDRLLALDSYAVHQLVDYQVRGFDAALRSEAFPADWAPGAKAV